MVGDSATPLDHRNRALALGSVPIALGALAGDVYAQSGPDVIDVLQFALTLEYVMK